MNLNARVNIKSISSHCNLIQLQNVFILLYLFIKIPLVHHTKLYKNIPSGNREKVIFLSLLVLVPAAILDSRRGSILRCMCNVRTLLEVVLEKRYFRLLSAKLW